MTDPIASLALVSMERREADDGRALLIFDAPATPWGEQGVTFHVSHGMAEVMEAWWFRRAKARQLCYAGELERLMIERH
jgi:hypothetical protein